MNMRAIWTGFVSFGLVNVPVKLYGATEDHDVKAHQVHAEDGGRIRYKKVCEDCGEVVEQRDIAKCYEHEGAAVILTDDELTALPEADNRAIEVLEFIPATDLDPMLFDKSYFLGPQKGTDKAYALLAAALGNTERVALARFAMRGKTRMVALRILPKEGVIVAHTLLWPDEIRHADFAIDAEVKPAELAMAEKLVESMANEYNPDRYRDTYQEELRELIAAKAEGAPVTPRSNRTVGTEDVSDLLAQLEASLKGKGAK
jgi:DNA end-binding protein Ku